jgi:hypothetical protein
LGGGGGHGGGGADRAAAEADIFFLENALKRIAILHKISCWAQQIGSISRYYFIVTSLYYPDFI